MNEHSIFIGDKPFMNYVTAVIMQFTTEEAQEVVLKARGKHISRCVDVSQVIIKKFLEEIVSVKKIEIDSSEFENKDEKKVQVSTIEITLEKNN